MPRRPIAVGRLGAAVVLALSLTPSVAEAAPPSSEPRPNRPNTSQKPREKSGKKDQELVTRQVQAQAKAKAARRRDRPRRGPKRRTEGIDASRLPRGGPRSVVQRREREADGQVLGFAAALDAPRFHDRRKRMPPADPPAAGIGEFHVGTEWYWAVYFGGNPAGLAEAQVLGVEHVEGRDAPVIRMRARGEAAGVVSIVSTASDEMVSVVDQKTGATVVSTNTIERSGLLAPYKKRVTRTTFEGRQKLRIVDTKDDKQRKLVKRVPGNTMDPLSAMAWVRSLWLDDGERAQSHTLDGRLLLRIDVIGRGNVLPDPMPSLAAGLGVKDENIRMIEGTLTRVDRYDVPIPDKDVFTFRAYLTKDGIPLVMETDLFLGVMRLILERYTPGGGPLARDVEMDDPPPAPAASPDEANEPNTAAVE